jgi:hypothetical protein
MPGCGEDRVENQWDTSAINTELFLRSARFWDITQRRVVNCLPAFRDNVSVPSSRSKVQEEKIKKEKKFNTKNPKCTYRQLTSELHSYIIETHFFYAPLYLWYLQNAMLSWDSDIERAPISKQTSDEFLL